MCPLTVLPFFLEHLMNSEYMISSWSVTSKPILMISSNFLCKWSSPWQNHVGQNFVCNLQNWWDSIITKTCFIIHLINRYNDWLFPFLRQFLWWNVTNREQPKNWDKNLSHCHSVHHMGCLGIETGLPWQVISDWLPEPWLSTTSCKLQFRLYGTIFVGINSNNTTIHSVWRYPRSWT